MKIIVGLGNPGQQYEHTRHNIGFRVVNALAKELNTDEWKYSEKFNALITNYPATKLGAGKLQATSYKLILPQTFMNLSGKSVPAILRFYKADPAKDLLVISDDKDMVFGKLRMRSIGSSGGHKGLQSIIDCLGTDLFHRLKIGIGHENQLIPTDDFVLQKFSKEEEEQLSKIINNAVKKILEWMNA